MMYTAAFGSMFEGSMCGAGANVFAVWLFALSRCDKDGDIELCPKPVSLLIGCSIEDVEEAINYLVADDEDSRSPAEGGKRLILTGKYLYRVVNHEYYRKLMSYEKKKEADRERMAAKRAENATKQTTVADGRKQSQGVAHGPEPEPEPEVGIESPADSLAHPVEPDDRFEEFWKVYPRKVGKKRAQTAWRNMTAKDRDAALAALPLHINHHWQGKNSKYTPHPTTWLNGERWDDEIGPSGGVRSAHADEFDYDGNPK